MKLFYVAALAMLLPLTSCTMVEERFMKAAVDNADKIAKFADLYCKEVDVAKRIELRGAIAKLRGGNNVIIEC